MEQPLPGRIPVYNITHICNSETAPVV